MKEIAAQYARTLLNVAGALAASFGPVPHWGIAGFREETLVFLLAETLRGQGWDVGYEQGYGDGRRSDLVASTGPHERLWVEAKWWWRHVPLASVLAMDEPKLRIVGSDFRRIALVFTVGHERGWSTATAARGMDRALGAARRRWSLVGCAAVPSPFFGTVTPGQKEPRPCPKGVFAAAFYEMRPESRATARR